VNYAYIPAAIFAISLTATRFAMLAILPAFLFGIGTFGRLKPLSRVLIFVILTAALFALPSLIPQSSLQRLATTADEISTGDLSGRAAIWQQGLAVFVEHPLLGIGRSAFPTAVESGRSAHNSFLVVLVELGMIGSLLFGIILAMTVSHAIHQPKWDARFWLTILLVWAVGNLAMSWAHKKPTWLFLSLVVVAANVSVQPVQSKRGSQFPVRSPEVLKGRSYEAN
jgi:O-antigen ligase